MENPSSNMLCPKLDFKFAFNDTTFSDRVLHIEIISDFVDSNSVEVSRVKTLHINSAILAANSPFFYKLLKNGMRESLQKDELTLRINESEEAALTELLSFMYGNTLSVTTTPDLLDVLLVADKFEVTSCVKYCSELLQKMAISQESAVLYLELHSSAFVGEVVQPLVDAAKEYLVARYKEPYESQEDLMALPLCAIEVVFGSDRLRAYSEDEVYILIMKWARSHYPKLEERREILTKRLARLIRFPFMSSSKLEETLVCEDFDQEQVSKLVLKALLFKFEGQHILSSTHPAASNCGFIARAYKFRPIKVVQFDGSRPRCVVYFDLNKEECEHLLQSKVLQSELFFLGEQWYRLLVIMGMENRLALAVITGKSSATNCTSDCDFAVMKKPLEEFQSIYKVKNHPQKSLGPGAHIVTAFMNDLFGIPWIDSMADDSEYFIDDILHLRVELTINIPKA